jgi:hypothetical protein
MAVAISSRLPVENAIRTLADTLKCSIIEISVLQNCYAIRPTESKVSAILYTRGNGSKDFVHSLHRDKLLPSD